MFQRGHVAQSLFIFLLFIVGISLGIIIETFYLMGGKTSEFIYLVYFAIPLLIIILVLGLIFNRFNKKGSRFRKYPKWKILLIFTIIFTIGGIAEIYINSFSNINIGKGIYWFLIVMIYLMFPLIFWTVYEYFREKYEKKKLSKKDKTIIRSLKISLIILIIILIRFFGMHLVGATELVISQGTNIYSEYDSLDIYGCSADYITKYSIFQIACDSDSGGHCVIGETGELDVAKKKIGQCLCEKLTKDYDIEIATEIINICNETYCYSKTWNHNETGYINDHKNMNATIICENSKEALDPTWYIM